MALINEKETSFELVEALLKYIETLKVAGAVLVFLPGWNLIHSMQRHLETNPHFGTPHATPTGVRLSRLSLEHVTAEHKIHIHESETTQEKDTVEG